MARAGGHASEFLVYDSGAKRGNFGNRSALQPFGEHGSGGDRRGAAANLVPGLGDPPVFKSGAQAQDVAARGILDFNGERGRG